MTEKSECFIKCRTMSRSIAQLLPIPELQEKRIQVDIPASLYEKAEAIKRERKLKWNQVITALLEKMVEDIGTPRDARSWK